MRAFQLIRLHHLLYFYFTSVSVVCYCPGVVVVVIFLERINYRGSIAQQVSGKFVDKYVRSLLADISLFLKLIFSD